MVATPTEARRATRSHRSTSRHSRPRGQRRGLRASTYVRCHHRAGRGRRLEDTASTLDLAFCEVSSVAVRAWHDQEAAGRLRTMAISVHDASSVAAADAWSARLVSCDSGDLVSRGLAVLPADIRTAMDTELWAWDDTERVPAPLSTDAEAASIVRAGARRRDPRLLRKGRAHAVPWCPAREVTAVWLGLAGLRWMARPSHDFIPCRRRLGAA